MLRLDPATSWLLIVLLIDLVFVAVRIAQRRARRRELRRPRVLLGLSDDGRGLVLVCKERGPDRLRIIESASAGDLFVSS